MTIQPEDAPANDIGDVTPTTASRLHDAVDSVRDAADAARAATGDAYAAARDKVGDVLGTAKEKSGAAYEAAREKAGETLETARDKASEAYGVARDKAADAYGAAREKATDAYGAAREKATDAYEAAREKASTAGRAASDGIEDNPLAALVGGIALGVLVGALLPRSQRETDALGPIATRLTQGARAAAFAARDAGRDKLDELGLNRSTARDTVEKLFDTAVKAATTAGTAAADTVRQS